MTAVTIRTGASTGAGPTIGRVARAEWIKFATLPSHLLTTAAAVAVIVILAVVLLGVRAGEAAPTTLTELLAGVSWAQLLVPVLAVVFVCSEWSEGTTRISFLAPRSAGRCCSARRRCWAPSACWPARRGQRAHWRPGWPPASRWATRSR